MRRLAIAVLAVVLLSGCVFNPGASTDRANDLAIQNQRSDPVTVTITVSQNGTVVYRDTHEVTEEWTQSDLVEQGETYRLRASVPGGPTATKTWNTATACGSPTVRVYEDRITIPYGPC